MLQLYPLGTLGSQDTELLGSLWGHGIMYLPPRAWAHDYVTLFLSFSCKFFENYFKLSFKHKF